MDTQNVDSIKKFNDFIFHFSNLFAKNIVNFEFVYKSYYLYLEELFGLDEIGMYIFTYDSNLAKLELQYEKPLEKGTFSKEKLEKIYVENTYYKILNTILQHDDIVYHDKYTLETKFNIKNAPNILITSMLHFESQILGLISFFTYQNVDNPIFSKDNKTFLNYISNIMALLMKNKLNEKRISYLLFTDYLTELPNRNYFYEIIVSALQNANIMNTQLAILMVDIDNLKHINDTLGYSIGDHVIKIVGTRLKDAVGSNNIVSRFGGDDFSVLLPNIPSYDYIYEICNRIISFMKKTISIYNYDLISTVSIGVSIYPEHGENVDDMIKNADAAMNSIKNIGKNSFKFYEEKMTELTTNILFLNNELPQAITYKQEQFEIYYQGLLNLKTNNIKYVEALVRWIHPEKGIISPGEFIPYAEENGLIIAIDKMVLRKACMQAREWNDKGLDITVSVNISPKHFMYADLFQNINDILSETGLPPSKIDIEFLESTLIEDMGHTLKLINKLKEVGISVSLDDFGSGYSSLEYITTLPIDIIKIDRSFTMKLEKNPNNKIIIKMVMTMASELNLKVVAEGVENERQLEYLRSLKCHMAQGYYINRPLPKDEMEKIINKYNKVVD